MAETEPPIKSRMGMGMGMEQVTATTTTECVLYQESRMVKCRCKKDDGV
jgi:hypothetical protein